MIDLRELRLYNWVYSIEIGEFVQIASIDIDCVTLKNHVTWDYVYADMIEPIPLTEEILLKCGFYKDEEDRFVIEEDLVDYIIQFSLDEDYTLGVRSVVDVNYFSWGIKHLHQLQNLYLALTGQELKIEL